MPIYNRNSHYLLLHYPHYLINSFSSRQLVQMWDMIEELENNSTNHAKIHHVNKLNYEMQQQRSQLGNITDALPIIKNRVHGIDEKIQKLSSTLPDGNDFIAVEIVQPHKL